MQINTGTNSIFSDIDFLCETDSISYPVADKTRNVNRWAYRAMVAMIKGSNRWQYDDPNIGGLPFVTLTMTDQTHEVVLPSSYLQIKRVEVLDADGRWSRLKLTDQTNIKGSYAEYKNTPGIPDEYDLIGGYLYLFPAPDASQVTLVNGIRLHIAREIDLFTVDDTAQEPGFPEPFHDVCSFGASHDHELKAENYDKADRYFAQAQNQLKELEGFASESTETPPRIRPSHRTVTYT